MEESLRTLKKIGAQKIHKDTHISKDYAQAIIHGSFEGMNPVQLAGFISILEREYNVDLSELKRKAKEHVSDVNENSSEPKKVFINPGKKSNSSTIYIVLALIVFASVAYYSFGYLSSIATSEPKIDNSQIEDAQKSIETTLHVKNITDETKETNTTKSVDTIQAVTFPEADSAIESLELVSEEVIEEVKEEVKTLKILPKNKIWAGYIDIATNQKYQKIFRKEFAIDVSKNWLLLFGSGTVHLEVNGEKQTFSSKQNMRFKYKDGVFTKITVTEFKSLNKGRKW